MIAWFAALALAADPPPDDADESISGFDRSNREGVDVPFVGPEAPPGVLERAAASGESARRGAEQLSMDPAFVAGIQTGLEKLYRREYAETKAHFVRLEGQFPNTGVAAVVDVLVWQARMLENFDFQYAAQYETASKVARSSLDNALANPGNEAWEHFLYAGVVGIESIHTVRTGSYLPALQLAFEAMDHVATTRELAPLFTDLLLADGMYNYWRTILTKSSKFLPDFGDKRAEGLAQMAEVESQGIFLTAPATLSLVFSYIEEGRYDLALGRCQHNRTRYPDNVINNLLTGTTYVYLRKYPDALRIFDEVSADAPDNRRVRYWRGIALMRGGSIERAETEFQAYLASPYLEKWQKSSTWWRLGQLYQRQKRYAEADAAYTQAVGIDGHGASKSALSSLRDQRRRGTISY
jgi:tetratricopeptide (TPR) repeat protein